MLAVLGKEEEGEVSSISPVNFCSMGICQIQSKGRNKGRVEVSHRLYNQVRGWVKGQGSTFQTSSRGCKYKIVWR